MNIKRTALALLAALQLAGAARAEGMLLQTDGEAQRRTPVAIYVAQGALGRAEAERLAQLLEETFEQGAFSLVYEEEAGSLRGLVMADHAPQVVVCAPAEAMPWAMEGMLAPLDGRVPEIGRMQEEVVEACVQDERLYMAPMAARHRRLAVNARLVHAADMGAMLDPYACPVWVPSQMDLLLEELQMAQLPALDFWLTGGAQTGGDAAAEAFLQALYGGELLAPGGDGWRNAASGLNAALSWLEERVECGLITVCGSREEALERFLGGETAMFIGWMEEDARRYDGRLRENGVELAVVDYPSALGLPVRSWELTGAAAFIGDDPQQTALAMEAAAFLCSDERALAVLGPRRIWKDGAVWLRCPGADSRSATMRVRFARALNAVLEGGQTAEEAVSALAALAGAMR